MPLSYLARPTHFAANNQLTALRYGVHPIILNTESSGFRGLVEAISDWI